MTADAWNERVVCSGPTQRTGPAIERSDMLNTPPDVVLAVPRARFAPETVTIGSGPPYGIVPPLTVPMTSSRLRGVAGKGPPPPKATSVGSGRVRPWYTGLAAGLPTPTAPP